MRWTHIDEEGRARMVDVSRKPPTARRAIAEASVRFGERAFELLRENRLGKGDAIAVARIAAIQAAKRTAELVPLCHSIPLDHVDVEVLLDEPSRAVTVRATAAATWTTGVEMEALTAVSVAALTLYDMAKAVDRGMEIGPIRLIEKSGGRSGVWRRDDAGADPDPGGGGRS